MARTTKPKAGATPKPTATTDSEVVKIIGEYMKEAEGARRSRIEQNKVNWASYFGNQDWSHKQDGQSTECLPKVGEAVEQFAAFVKRALTQFGDWFSVDVPRNSPITPEQARALMMHYLNNIYVGKNKTVKFSTVLSNAIKSGLLESLIVLKVHGCMVTKNVFVADFDSEQPKAKEAKSWQLKLDLCPNEDYYPDPTTRFLYEVHRAERDLIDVQYLAEAGIYDKAVVAQITEDFERADQDRRTAKDRNQNESTPPAYRKRVVIDEMWGTLLGKDGKVKMENCLAARANEKYEIRKPEPIPFWHGSSPFVVAPLVQVPYSVWGKALYDHAVSLNTALNELFNLMLDGGIAEVWGIRQVRTGWLENPAQVAGGIPQGATLAVNENVPIDGKVVERIDDRGAVPAEALNMFNLADREFQAASLLNDIRLGELPQRQVKATEVVESSNNSAVLLDSFTSDLEHEIIEPALEKTWMNLIQHADDLAADEVIQAIGADAAFALSRMSPAERYAIFGQGFKFKAYGLSSTLSRARDFQKLMSLMQAVGTNPILMQTFLQRYSPDKILDFIMKSLNINPMQLEQTPEEKAQMGDRIQQMMAMTALTGGAQQASPMGGQENTNGEIAQGAMPTGGPR